MSSSAVGEAIKAKLDLQALSLVLATRFVFYKAVIESLPLKGAAKKSWKQLVEMQESIIDTDLGSQGEHFAVLEVLPSMPVQDGEIQLPSRQDVKQAFRKKSKQFHTDKQYCQGRSQQRHSGHLRQRARTSAIMAEWMIRKVVGQNTLCL